MGYVTPADVGVSDNWQDHIDRGSAEPGTDYMTAFGTDLRMPGDGMIALADNNPAGAEGRRLQLYMDDGRVIDFIHGYWIHGNEGQRVSRGQTGIFISGASGWGEEYYYGAHVHVTLRANVGKPFKDTLNFELYLDEEDDVSKQDVKDALFEFYRDVNTFPPNHPDWPFIQQAVWKAPLPAQDEDGNPIYDGNGKPVTFDAQGFAASTNAQIGAIRNEVESVSTINRYVYGGLGLLLIANVILTGVLVANLT